MNNEKNSFGKDIPLGLGMAFMQNTDAFEHFSSLSGEQQQAVIAKARDMRSKREMQALVDGLGTRN